jgi:hypothetical protein
VSISLRFIHPNKAVERLQQAGENLAIQNIALGISQTEQNQRGFRPLPANGAKVSSECLIIAKHPFLTQ